MCCCGNKQHANGGVTEPWKNHMRGSRVLCMLVLLTDMVAFECVHAYAQSAMQVFDLQIHGPAWQACQ